MASLKAGQIRDCSNRGGKDVRNRSDFTPANVSFALVAGAASGAAMVSTPSYAAKAPQKAVKYQDTPKGDQSCENCALFEAPSILQDGRWNRLAPRLVHGLREEGELVELRRLRPRRLVHHLGIDQRQDRPWQRIGDPELSPNLLSQGQLWVKKRKSFGLNGMSISHGKSGYLSPHGKSGFLSGDRLVNRND